MDRLFLDANVLFSAAWRPEAGVQRLWRVSGVVLLSSSFTVEEAARNLEEPAQHQRLGGFLERVQVVGTRNVAPHLRRGIVLPDKDWPVLGGALAAEATHLITGDARHFGRYFSREVLGVLVLTPAMYLGGKG
ncbi:MAG: DNA-binding protein [Gemmatimonadales bacterium]